MNWKDVPKAKGRDDLPLKPNGKPWAENLQYEPEDCVTLYYMMREGASPAECARAMGVHYATLQRWRKDFPEFEAAYTMGHDHALGWFEEQMRDTLIIEGGREAMTRRLDTRSYAFTMSTRFGIVDRRPEEKAEKTPEQLAAEAVFKSILEDHLKKDL